MEAMRYFVSPFLVRWQGVALACLWLAAMATAQEFGRTEIMEISRGLRYTDGPAWSPAGFLLFADVPNNRLFKYTPGGATNLIRENTGGISGMAFDKDGRLFAAESVARRLSKSENDADTVLLKNFEGKALNAPNDIVVRRNGDILFTDPAYGTAVEERELDFHGLFFLSHQGELTVLKRSQTRLSGLALSPDDNTIYVTDTDQRLVLALVVSKKGEVRNEREFLRVDKGIPTGLCVDTKGNIYVTAERILVYDKDGRFLGHYNTPGKPTNCTFGEADGKALFVTAGGGLYRIQSSVPGLLPR